VQTKPLSSNGETVFKPAKTDITTIDVG